MQDIQLQAGIAGLTTIHVIFCEQVVSFKTIEHDKNVILWYEVKSALQLTF